MRWPRVCIRPRVLVTERRWAVRFIRPRQVLERAGCRGVRFRVWCEGRINQKTGLEVLEIEAGGVGQGGVDSLLLFTFIGQSRFD
jgi:hypothetical protein